MKKYALYFFLLFFVPSVAFIGCKDEATVAPAFTTMTDYMVDNDLDLSTVMSYHSGDVDIKFVAGAPATEADVAPFVAKYYIMDIRSAADFANGHIEGAHNVVFANILTEAASAGAKPIMMVCYTGQTACYATALLRLYGYKNAQALKWGMTGWNSTLDKWTANVADLGKDNANWTYDNAPAVVKFNAPVINASTTDGKAILDARVEAVVAAGFKTINGADVLDNPTGYFVNNYFAEADYSAFGHVKGAYRINPLTIADDIIYNINPDAKVVTYCYTGQTSAVVTAYLNVLGYDAYSLLFGMNKMYHSSSAWTSSKWDVATGSKNYPLVK
jgi:rhodanese-related sulfurtransferase